MNREDGNYSQELHFPTSVIDSYLFTLVIFESGFILINMSQMAGMKGHNDFTECIMQIDVGHWSSGFSMVAH